MRESLKFYIDGQWVSPAVMKQLDVENPATTHDAFSVGSGMFRLQFTNVTSGSEAYDLIRLA